MTHRAHRRETAALAFASCAASPPVQRVQLPQQAALPSLPTCALAASAAAALASASSAASTAADALRTVPASCERSISSSSVPASWKVNGKGATNSIYH